MRKRVLKYRDEIVRAVIGSEPTMFTAEADFATLDLYSCFLSDHEEAKRLLVANGHGQPTQSLTDIVKVMLNQGNGGAR